MKPHKHAELIKAWADGAEIETWDCGHWYLNKNPDWSDSRYEHRIKPEPKPDVIKETHIVYEFECNDWTLHPTKKPNIRFYFDGETGKLKSAEVIK